LIERKQKQTNADKLKNQENRQHVRPTKSKQSPDPPPPKRAHPLTWGPTSSHSISPTSSPPAVPLILPVLFLFCFSSFCQHPFTSALASPMGMHIFLGFLFVFVCFFPVFFPNPLLPFLATSRRHPIWQNNEQETKQPTPLLQAGDTPHGNNNKQKQLTQTTINTINTMLLL
jgi:hypothetical protein